MNEQIEIDHLTGKGFEIQTVLFGRPKIWRTKKMTLGRLIELSEIYITISVNESIYEKTDFHEIVAEQYISVNKDAKKAAQALAIAVTDHKWLRPFLVRHFLKNINAAELLVFATKLLKQGDYQNFILSIGLMNGNRITKADPIEKTV